MHCYILFCKTSYVLVMMLLTKQGRINVIRYDALFIRKGGYEGNE